MQQSDRQNVITMVQMKVKVHEVAGNLWQRKPPSSSGWVRSLDLGRYTAAINPRQLGFNCLYLILIMCTAITLITDDIMWGPGRLFHSILPLLLISQNHGMGL